MWEESIGYWKTINKLKAVSGVTEQLLLDNEIVVMTENDFKEKLRDLK